MTHRWLHWTVAGTATLIVGLGVATTLGLRPLPEHLDPLPGQVKRAEVLDRHGERLSVTYENAWNLHDRVPLHEVPRLLRRAIVEAEDHRFFDHGGVDWKARFHAVWMNLRAGRAVRGASTISEQVVRLLHPRPRTPWSRWLEGFEAARLEYKFSKGGILSFYLNQVPYARQRRGVVQAARDLFDRDLGTLNPRETLALAVLLRRPSGLDPRRNPGALDGRVQRLSQRLEARGLLAKVIGPQPGPFDFGEARLPVAAPAFVRRARSVAPERVRIHTTLDGQLQAALQGQLDAQVERLRDRGVQHGAAIVINHERNEVVAWLNASGGSEIDAVSLPRQPGSTLKPFLYALALERGWTAATLIDDSPLSSAVGAGLHRTRNYSLNYRGPIRLRLALANSLNVPAIRTMQSLPAGAFHRRLQDLGFTSLDRPAAFYGDGLALGNGEVTLLELATAYAVLARGGIDRPVRVLAEEAQPGRAPHRVFPQEVSSIITDILADADARASEFGRGGVLDFPAPAAVKTGTSDDYRDSWAVGFSSRYTAGVWMGDLDRRPMKEVTGSLGPAVVLRGFFAELHRFEAPRPLRISRSLRRIPICSETGQRAGAHCPMVEEWMRPEHAPAHDCAVHARAVAGPSLQATGNPHSARVARPTPGLRLAMDPRIPDELEVFPFALETDGTPRRVEWIIDGRSTSLKPTPDQQWEWPLTSGPHRVEARIQFESGGPVAETPPVSFVVR